MVYCNKLQAGTIGSLLLSAFHLGFTNLKKKLFFKYTKGGGCLQNSWASTRKICYQQGYPIYPKEWQFLGFGVCRMFELFLSGAMFTLFLPSPGFWIVRNEDLLSGDDYDYDDDDDDNDKNNDKDGQDDHNNDNHNE